MYLMKYIRSCEEIRWTRRIVQIIFEQFLRFIDTNTCQILLKQKKPIAMRSAYTFAVHSKLNKGEGD